MRQVLINPAAIAEARIRGSDKGRSLYVCFIGDEKPKVRLVGDEAAQVIAQLERIGRALRT